MVQRAAVGVPGFSPAVLSFLSRSRRTAYFRYSTIAYSSRPGVPV
jgi:hypothetical protein